VLAQAARKRLSLIVPELVVRELVNKRRENAVEADRRLRQARATLVSLGVPVEVTLIDLEPVAAEIDATVRKQLAAANVEIIDFAQIDHATVVERALARRKPFAESGAGYRDALIWHNVLEVLMRDDKPVVFVTNNRSDFAEDKEGRKLADDLVRDLEAASIDIQRLTLVSTLVRFAAEHIAPESLAEGELDEKLNGPTSVREQFANSLQNALAGHVFEGDDVRDLDLDRLDLGWEVEDPEIDAAEVVQAYDLHGVWVTGASLIDENTALVEIEAEIDAELELSLTVRERRSYLEDDDGWPPMRERRSRGFGTTLLIGAEATYRRAEEQLDEINVFYVRP
jgi:hypothetical protein